MVLLKQFDNRFGVRLHESTLESGLDTLCKRGLQGKGHVVFTEVQKRYDIGPIPIALYTRYWFTVTCLKKN